MPAVTMDANATDNLKDHILENVPRDNDRSVALGATISVIFDREVKTVNIEKLFEVRGSSFEEVGGGVWERAV